VRVVFEGRTEARPRMLLEALLEQPRERRRRDDDERRACVEPVVPPEWLASVDDDVVHPGLVRNGVRRAVQRLTDRLFDRGFEMATLSAELSPDGTLLVRVDEGRIRALELRGVHPRIEGQVRERLELPVGSVYDREDLGSAYRRMRDAFPFLDSDGRGPGRLTRPRPTVVEETADGARRYRLVEQDPKMHGGSTTVDGNKLTVYLRSRQVELDVDGTEIVKHTPVTGFAPGLEVRGRLWDPANRVHLTVDLGGNVNSYRARRAENALEPLAGNDRWRFDWMAGPKVSIPDLRVAELGVQFYGRVDTSDRCVSPAASSTAAIATGRWSAPPRSTGRCSTGTRPPASPRWSTRGPWPRCWSAWSSPPTRPPPTRSASPTATPSARSSGMTSTTGGPTFTPSTRWRSPTPAWAVTPSSSCAWSATAARWCCAPAPARA
jgi:hypothetical protein